MTQTPSQTPQPGGAQASLRRYALYGLSIASPFPLPGAPCLDAVEGPAHRTAATPGIAPPGGTDLHIGWIAADAEPDLLWPSAAAPAAGPQCAQRPQLHDDPAGNAYVTWPGELSFRINAGRDRVDVCCRAAKLEFAPTVLVGFVLGYALHLRGTLCLHGAVLARQGRAIGVLGDSGAGKSTLSAALLKSGAALVSDDVLVISSHASCLCVQPGYAGLRLNRDSAQQLLGCDDELPVVPYLGKHFWSAAGAGAGPHFHSGAAPLDAVYVLEKDQECSVPERVGPLPPAAALRRLVAAWYPPEHPQLLTQTRLHDLTALAARLPVYVLRHARRWEQLPQLLALLDA